MKLLMPKMPDVRWLSDTDGWEWIDPDLPDPIPLSEQDRNEERQADVLIAQEDFCNVCSTAMNDHIVDPMRGSSLVRTICPR